jgi:DNA-binding CsgD family transcriptional regulator
VDRGFNEAEAEFVATVVRSFGVGMRLGILAGAASVTDVPNGPSVLVVDGDDELVQVSVDAEAMFEHLDWGDWRGWAALPQALLSLVAGARGHGAGEYPHAARVRLRSPSGTWLVAHASLLAGRDGRRSSVVITIEEARPPEIVPLVVAAYGLTPREQDVVRVVLKGVDTAEVARTLHMSSYTVQDHLKSIFAKAGVRSRRELTAKVYFDQYAPRLGQDLAPSGWFAGTSSAD